MLANIDLASEVVGALVGLAIGLTVPLSIYLRRRWLARGLNRFWRAYQSKAVAVVQTEYLAADVLKGLDDDVARAAGDGELITKGMGRATALLEGFLLNVLKIEREHLIVLGDKSDTLNGQHLVVIGSEVNNTVSKSIMGQIRGETNLKIRAQWETKTGDSNRTDHPATGRVVIRHGDSIYGPEEIDGSQYDYCLIVQRPALSRSGHEVLLISGCHMHGSLAGIKAVTDPSFATLLAAVRDKQDSVVGVVALVRCHVVNGAVSTWTHIFADREGEAKYEHMWPLLDGHAALQ